MKFPWPQKNSKKRKKTPTEIKLLRRKILLLIGLVLVIIFIIVGIYHGTRIESKQITGVRVVGGQTIAHTEIEKIVNDSLVGNFYLIIPKRFTWTYPKEQIKDAVLVIDRVKNVDVSLENNDQVLVVFEEYVPKALWCDELEVNCLFIDGTGFAFAESPKLSGSAFVRYINDGSLPKKGEYIFNGDFIKQNEDFMEKMQTELGLYITHIEKIGEYDIEYRVSGGGRIKTSVTMDLDKTFRNLRSVLQSDDFIHLEAGKFQYIDLRFGDKIFVNEEIGLLDTENASSTSVEDAP